MGTQTKETTGITIEVEHAKIAKVIAALTYLGIKIVPSKGWESIPVKMVS